MNSFISNLRLALICGLTLLVCANLTAQNNQPNQNNQTEIPGVDFNVRDGIGRTLAKLRAGETVNVAYLGGSITMANGWRPKTTAWLQKEFPTAKVNEIHAAISGTGSALAIHRLKRDVLRHDPDLLFVEFAVNDHGTPDDLERQRIGSIVRQTWENNPETDVVFVYAFCVPFAETVRNGKLPPAAEVMESVAELCGIPSINFTKRIVSMEQEKRLLFTPSGETIPPNVLLWSNDGTHPLDAGHALYLLDVQRAFHAMKDLPTTNHGEKLKNLNVKNEFLAPQMLDVVPEMLSGAWRRVEKGENCFEFTRFLDELWTTDEPGARLEFTFKGREAQIYDVVGPTAGQVKITVDGKTLEKPLPRCDAYCVNYFSFRITSSFIIQNLDPESTHTVTLELCDEEPDRAKMADGRSVKPEETNGEKFRGKNLWVGKILTR